MIAQEKILKPYTIIPDHLYVQRDADRQVLQVIQDMGRPGYVLVARQMGKTNLLINAKSKLQTKNDIFLYVDLSNSYETSRECFRGIIDKAVETNFETFGGIYEVIEDNRNKKLLPPHTEHGQELRLLLKTISGKLVIILDEIDALTKAKFSDEIFAQIRSIYFERINFTEYNRLTYLLSGVVEPTEIIKNPKISPFNIGQKIFLNDFTYGEFNDFCRKANLILPEKILLRVFDWTSGNPRMTYDVCSEVESYILKGHDIDISLIDRIIEDIYLTAFDKAPIDHIRELVEIDNEIRQAIVQIRYHKGNVLSDEIKKKLYLAGIINSDFQSSKIEIKNKIIDKALSESWIESVEKKKKGVLKLALERYSSKEFNEVIKLYEGSIEDIENLSGNDIAPLAFSYFETQKYSKAIPFLLKIQYDKKGFPEAYYETLYAVGISYAIVGDYPNAIRVFSEIVDEYPSGKYYFQSRVNLSSSYFQLNYQENKELIISFDTQTIEELNRSSNPERDKFLTIAYYNLCQLFESLNDSLIAKEYIKKALDVCPLESKSQVLLKWVLLEEDNVEKKNALTQTVDLIIKNNYKPEEANINNLLSVTHELIDILLYELYRMELLEGFESLLNYIIKLENSEEREVYIYKIAIQLLSKGEHELCQKVIRPLFEMQDESFPNLATFNAFRIYTIISPLSNWTVFAPLYVNYFYQNYMKLTLSDIDFKILYFYLLENLERKRYEEIRKMVNILTSIVEFIDDQVKINFVSILYIELLSLAKMGFPHAQVSKAREILSLCSKYKNVKRDQYDFMNATTLEHIEKYSSKLIGDYGFRPHPNFSSYDRNDKLKIQYLNGEIKEKKFKQVEEDLRAGLCRIISSQ
ncbi:AAA-like domain-containing protein [Sporocytophaga myxococcoides]|uniref:AAA-like domain-containing protein n=1 Tax=Sporocytophaga myxococcoides TaxID=153721 RepID=UPI00041949BA|nr:AAA-like domain-containing protein [Sporocytophaga myxococcoides]